MPEDPADPKTSTQEKSKWLRGWRKKALIGVGVGALTVVGAGAAVLAAPAVLTAAGFTAAGVQAGSIGAAMMSSAAVANGGGVAAGSVVAILQSAGAGGAALATVQGGAAVGGAVLGATGGAAVAGVAEYVAGKEEAGKPEKDKDRSSDKGDDDGDDDGGDGGDGGNNIDKGQADSHRLAGKSVADEPGDSTLNAKPGLPRVDSAVLPAGEVNPVQGQATTGGSEEANTSHSASADALTGVLPESLSKDGTRDKHRENNITAGTAKVLVCLAPGSTDKGRAAGNVAVDASDATSCLATSAASNVYDVDEVEEDEAEQMAGEESGDEVEEEY